MSDIRIKLQDDFSFDLGVANGDLEFDEGLETAVTISLFSDRRVSDEELPPGQKSKRGFWGDMFSETPDDKIGSRLWTLAREKKTNETLRKAEDFVREALAWLLEDGIAQNVSAQASYLLGQQKGILQLDISITRPSGRSSRFQVLWDKQVLKRVS